jgi:hypothetical protein
LCPFVWGKILSWFGCYGNYLNKKVLLAAVTPTNNQQIPVRQAAPYASITCRVLLAAPYNLYLKAITDEDSRITLLSHSNSDPVFVLNPG